MTRKHKPKDNSTGETQQSEGINMASLCRTLARVLVLVEEREYSHEKQQDTVLEHDALSDPKSVNGTQEA